MEEEIYRLKKEVERLTVENEHMKRQIAMSAGLRFHLMPNVYPVFRDIPEVDIYADQVSIVDAGVDFFDIFRVDSDHIGILMADIFDGGQEAALYMVAFKLYLSGELSMGFSPGKLMEVVNDRLVSVNVDNLCLSAFYGCYEISTGILTAVNASGEPPIIKNKQGCRLFGDEKRSYLMAVVEGMNYEEYRIQLEPGDALLLYTDGVVQAKNEWGERFGAERLIHAFNDSNEGNADGIVGDLQRELFSFIGEETLGDDASFLCLIREEETS